jgi:hypothetical protein
MRLEETRNTRNTYRIVVNASWRVVIFKTVKVGTSILVKKVLKIDRAREGNSASYGRIILKLKAKEGLQYAGWLQMVHDIGEQDVLFTTINLKCRTFKILTR